MNKDLKVLVMFDNAGGVACQFGNKYKHYYSDGKKAAKDFQEYVNNSGKTNDWEGNDNDCEIEMGKCSNGGHWTLDLDDIKKMLTINIDNDYDWVNMREFFEALTIDGDTVSKLCD